MIRDSYDSFYQISTWAELGMLYMAVGFGIYTGILIGMAIESMELRHD